jgi:hypothetical protein
MAEYARLRPLLGATSMDIASMLGTLLERLENADIGGNVRITLLANSGSQKWDLDLNAKQCQLLEGQERSLDRDLDLELVVSAVTWSEIALGRLAPLEAFGTGRLRLRGDAELANKLYEQFKDDAGGITSVCK